MNQRFVSSHFPYLPVLVEVPLEGGLTFTFVGDAFLAFGDAPIIGRGVIDRFAITLDHGQQVIVEK